MTITQNRPTSPTRQGGNRFTDFVGFGLLQARVEIVTKFTRPSALGYLLTPAIAVTLLCWIDTDTLFDGHGARSLVAGIAAASLFMGGFVGIASELVTEQDDGTMLRVRTLPNGLAGYLVGKSVSLLVGGLVSLLLLLIPAHLFVAPILPANPLLWAALLGVAVLALFSTVPIGAVLGCLAKSPMAVLPLSFVAYLLMAVSGIFFQIESLPRWLGGAVEVFPVYWLGELARATLVPGTAVSTGQLAAAIGVPLLWMVGGLLLAPRALRVMTRRQSGSRLDAVTRRRAARGY